MTFLNDFDSEEKLNDLNYQACFLCHFFVILFKTMTNKLSNFQTLHKSKAIIFLIWALPFSLFKITDYASDNTLNIEAYPSLLRVF